MPACLPRYSKATVTRVKVDSLQQLATEAIHSDAFGLPDDNNKEHVSQLLDNGSLGYLMHYRSINP